MGSKISVLNLVAVLLAAGIFVAQAMAQTPDSNTLTPPPAYTPPPKGAPPAEDTQAQKDSLARLKTRLETNTDNARKTYNSTVTPSYNFHYGQKNPYIPGNVQVQGEGFLHPGAYPSAEYCGTCHQEFAR